MSIVRWLVGATVFLLLLLVALDNADPVTLRFFRLAAWQAPLVFVVFSAFAIGVALGLLTGVARASRLKRQVAKLRREQRRGVTAPGPHGAAPDRSREPPPDAV